MKIVKVSEVKAMDSRADKIEYGEKTKKLSSLNAVRKQPGTAEFKLPQPECKNGVCSLNWKPQRPAA